MRQMRTRCVVSSFLSNLSWHDDNKIQMYQTADEVRDLVSVDTAIWSDRLKSMAYQKPIYFVSCELQHNIAVLVLARQVKAFVLVELPQLTQLWI